LDLLDFSESMLAVMFVAVGSDYCKKLKGIGIVTACNIVRSAFLGKKAKETSALDIVFKRLYQETYEKDNLSDDFKKDFEENFLAGLFMYRHPIVYDPIQGKCITVGDPELGGDPELVRYKPYAELCQDAARRAAVAGTLFESPMATFIAEGWISPRTLEPRDVNVELPDYVRSALGQGAHDDESMDQDETQEQVGVVEVEDDDDENDEEDPDTQPVDSPQGPIETQAETTDHSSIEPNEVESSLLPLNGDIQLSDERDEPSARNPFTEQEVIDILSSSDDEQDEEGYLETQAPMEGFDIDEPMEI
jgi:hypothetical protein